MNKKNNTLVDLLTKATINAKAFLTNTQIEIIAQDLENKRSSCCEDKYTDRGKGPWADYPFCDHVCSKCEQPCGIRVDVILTP